MGPCLLIMEQDPRLAHLLRRDLQDQGYTVWHADTGRAGLIQTQEDHPDLILVDLGLPDLDGGDVIRRLRRRVPIITLTARDAVGEKVRVLVLGADDYLVKPSHLEGLLARIHVQLRYRGPEEVKVGELVLRPQGREMVFRDMRVVLTPKEFEMLWLLAQEPGKVVRREELVAQVWQGQLAQSSTVTDAHMANLRNKLRGVEGYGLIRTVRGYGYALRT